MLCINKKNLGIEATNAQRHCGLLGELLVAVWPHHSTTISDSVKLARHAHKPEVTELDEWELFQSDLLGSYRAGQP